MEVIHDEDAVRVAISGLAGQVIGKYKEKNPLFVSLLNGGPVFSTLLMMEVELQDPDFCPEVSYLNVETYGNGQQAKEPQVTQPLSSSVDVGGRLVVVLDEVLDSGATMTEVEKDLYGLGADGVDLVVLVQKERQRQHWQQATLHGLTAPDEWLVGMGMNGAPGRPSEAYRFADYIGAIRQSASQ